MTNEGPTQEPHKQWEQEYINTTNRTTALERRAVEATVERA